MAKAATYQCPNCNGVLAYDAESGQLVCKSCGTVFGEGQVEQAIPTSSGASARSAQHVKTVEQFLNNAPWEISREGTAAAATAVRHSCPACGAEVIADQSTVSTSCPYCGNNMLVAGITTAGNLPQRILPFSVTREQAEAHMMRHFEHKWYLSRAFAAQVQHMQAVYVPYYLYDIDVEGWADYIAYDEVTGPSGGDIKDYYAFKRAGRAAFRRIPVDGSSKMPDAHMDAIAPFSLSEMRAFSPGYAAGYLMEVADEDAETCQRRAERLAKGTFERGMKDDVVDEPRIDGISSTVAHETRVETTSVHSCVLPVWLMHCTWETEQMLFAVNGETGKCVGDLPISKARRRTTVLALAAFMALAMFALLGAMTNNWHDTDGLGFLIAGAIAVVALVPMGIDSYFVNQMHTAVEARDAAMSYDGEGLVITERWRGEDRFRKESEALKGLKERNSQVRDAR